MSVFVLKLIAVVTMLIDHVGYIFFPRLLWLRFIGRCAFPIYAFLLVQGYRHTHSCAKYLGRLALFSILSEVCFDLAFEGRWPDWSYQNVFFTLALGLCALWCVDHADKALTARSPLASALAQGAVLVAFGWAATLVRSDYDAIGIAYIAAFYYADRLRAENPEGAKRLVWTVFGLSILYMPIRFGHPANLDQYLYLIRRAYWVYFGVLIPVLLVRGYDGMPGYKSRASQWGFYLFYPVHLLVLHLIRLHM